MSMQSLMSQAAGHCPPAHLAIVPDSRFREGQACHQGQGRAGLADVGPSGWFAGIWGF